MSASLPPLADSLARSVDDFLYALDRGDFGNGHRFSDGSESAYVADLRAKLDSHRADQALVTAAHRRGLDLVAEFYGRRA